MGGWAAMGLAIAHRERVQSLVLADTFAGIPSTAGGTRPPSIAPRVGRSTIPRSRTTSASQHPERAHLYLKIGGLRRDPHADQIAAAAARWAKSTFTDDAARPRSRMPTLFIVGTEDEIFPPASIAAAAARVPGVRVEPIDGAGHSPYFEQPDAWNALVTGLLVSATQ